MSSPLESVRDVVPIAAASVVVVVVVVVGIALYLARRVREKRDGPAMGPGGFTPQTRRHGRDRRGGRQLDVVGESQYQRTLERLAASRLGTGPSFDCEARLVAEPAHAEPERVRVEIEGHVVGELSPKALRAYGPVAAELAKQRRTLTVSATVTAGWPRGDDFWGNYGVLLHVPPAEELLRAVVNGEL